jgi:putative SOS response-associated peptidase YedK
MCGRYASSRKPESLVEEFEVVAPVKEELRPDWNVAPTKKVYAIVARADDEHAEPQRSLTVMRWGLVPSWAKDPAIGSRMINARVETVAEKPSFKRAFLSRRCLIPADGYYEWYTEQAEGGKPRKQPFYIHRADGASLAMAGIYEFWRDPTKAEDDPTAFVVTNSVITTSATDDVGRIHDRMPQIVERANWAAWLDPSMKDAQQALSLLTPAIAGGLEAYPVSTSVNAVRNNGPELIEPIPFAETDQGEPTLL